jgi:GR25 family glycosyltransferase involved in LPS biosynthesis
MYKFVINLKRRTDRLELFINNCPYPEYTPIYIEPKQKVVNVIYGFDAKNVDKELPSEQRLFNVTFCKSCKPTERGCFLSHLRIYKMMVDHNTPSAMIFEDDAQFSDQFEKKMKRLLEFLPKNWELVYFGGRFEKDFKMAPGTFIKVNDYIVQHNVSNWNGHSHDRTTHGYLLSLAGAKYLLEQFNKTVPKNGINFTNTINDCPVDHAPIDRWMLEQFKYKTIYNSVPLLCWSPAVGDSDIR